MTGDERIEGDTPEPSTPEPSTPDADVYEEPSPPEPARPRSEPAAIPDELSPDEGPSIVERIRRLPIPAISTAVLGVVAVLLGLMVFAPQIAPIKLGATRLAAEAQTNKEIEKVAARFARNFVTISYRTVDDDFERILRDATGSFRRRLAKIPEVIRDPYVESKGVSSGRVTEVSVLSRAGDTALVRVVLDRTISNEETPSPRSLTHSLELTLVNTPSGWKVADASQLPSATSTDG